MHHGFYLNPVAVQSIGHLPNRQNIEKAKNQSKLDFFKEEEIINREELENLKISSLPKYNTELATKVAKEQEKMANLPPIRGQGMVEFEFSVRTFPTPIRESNVEAEEKWAKNQKEALEHISKKSGIQGDLGEDQNDYRLKC